MSEPSIRTLRPEDLEDIARIDARVGGRPRKEYLRGKLEASQRGGVHISLCADVDGRPVGFLMGSVFYGEYGQAEPVATIDTLAVHPDFQGRGVGRALWRQLAENLLGLRVARVQTQVQWNDWRLLRFLEKVGFAPAKRICLEAALDEEAKR